MNSKVSIISFFLIIIFFVLYILFENNIIVALAIPFLIVLWIFLYKEFDVPLIIISFLTIARELGEEIRFTLNVLVLFYISYRFLYEYGINSKKYPKIPYKLQLTLFLIIISMFLSSLLSEKPITGLIEILRQILFFAIVYFLFAMLFRNQKMYNYIYAIIIAGSIIGFFIVYFLITSDTLKFVLQTQGYVQEGGFIENLAAAGGILAVSISMTLIFAIIFYKRNNIPLFILMILSLIFQVTGLFFSNSRAAILAVLVSIIIIIVTLYKKYLFRVTVVGIPVLISFILFTDFLDYLFLYFRFERIFANTRYLLWDISLNIFLQNPIFGVGPAQFKDYMYMNLPVILGSWDEAQLRWLYNVGGLGHSHNFFLFKLSELGIFGFIASSILIYLFFYYTRIVFLRFKHHSELNIIILGIIACASGLLVRSFFEATGILSYGWIIRDLPFWILFTIIIYLYTTKDYEPGSKRSSL